MILAKLLYFFRFLHVNEIVATIALKDLKKIFFFCRYKPLFDYFKEFSDVAFRVVADSYVTDDSGTGIVHCAPAFGEDDYRVCIENQVINKVCVYY